MSSYYQPQSVHPQPVYPAPTTVYYASPVVTQHPKATHNYAARYPRTTSTCLGVAQLFLAAISITGGIMAIIYNASLYPVGVGFWCGILYIIAGAVALAAGQNPTNSLITGTAACSGLVIAFGITEVTVAAIGVTEDVWCNDYQCVTWKGAAVASNCLMICAGSWEVIFGLWLLGVSCNAICSHSNPQTVPGPVTYMTGPSEAVFLQPGAPLPQYQVQYPPHPGPYNQQQQMMYTREQPPPPQMQLKGHQPYYANN